MRNRIIYILKQTLFWVVIFLLTRVLFEIYNFPKTAKLSVNEIFLSFVHGIRLDASITGYFIFVIGLLVALSVVVKPKFIKYPINYISYFLIFYVFLVTTIDMELYRNWGFRMDSTPLVYLNTPTEALASTPIWLFVTLVLFWIILSVSASWIYKKHLSNLVEQFPSIKWYNSFVLILFTAIYFIPIRGTFSVAPINAGTVFFSENQFANHAAVNVTWNFSDALTRIKKRKQDVNLITLDRAKEITSELFKKYPSKTKLLRTDNPNIIVIVLESFTADVVSTFGGIDGIAPKLSKLATEGIYFNNFYATASRSDKGLVSIISGYPPQLGVSIMNFPNKTRNLPSIAKSLTIQNYSSTFYYGGDADFGNIRSFMLNVGFQKVVDIYNLPNDFDKSSKWGVHDHEMFKYLIDECDAKNTPFFNLFFTLSSHDPYDVPNYSAIKGDDSRSKALNSIHYTDNALGNFIEQAKTRPWWNNTLIIITADHQGRYPNDREIHLPEHYNIPLLFLGGALATTPQVNSSIGSQQDISSTLLSLLHVNNDDFYYSKNLCSDTLVQSASYIWTGGVGLVTDKGKIAFDIKSKNIIYQSGDTLGLEKKAKAILQAATDDFNNKELK